jgi:hypothetical protein
MAAQIPSRKPPATLGKTLLLGTVLLLAFWGTRLIALDAFPLFIDETLHIDLGERIGTTSPFYNAWLGRVFTAWLHFGVQSAESAPVWSARAVTVLAVLPGVAAVLAIGRLAGGLWGMGLAGLLYLFSAYHMFFERLALADPVGSSLVLVALYFAFRLSRRAHWQDAVGCGALLFIAFGAKLSVVPYFALPVIAALTLGRYSLRQRMTWLAVSMGTLIGLCAVFVVGLRLLGHDYLTNSVSYGLAQRAENDIAAIILSNFDPARIAARVAAVIEMLAGYWGWPLLAAAGLAVVVLAAQRRWFLPLALLVPAAGMWINLVQETRYWIPAAALLLLSLAVVVGEGLRRAGPAWRAGTLGLVAAWAAAFWLPFLGANLTDPLGLPLPAWDQAQYIQSDAAGFGFDVVADYLIEQDAEAVIGILANCLALRYTYLDRLAVECPRIRHDGSSIPELTQLLNERRAPGVYAVLEAIDYLPAEAPGALVAVVERPTGGPTLRIYNLAPDAD